MGLGLLREAEEKCDCTYPMLVPGDFWAVRSHVDTTLGVGVGTI